MTDHLVPDHLGGGQVMDMWATHFGAEAGMMGLRLIPTAGLFLAGGMTPKNLGYLQVRYGCELRQGA